MGKAEPSENLHDINKLKCAKIAICTSMASSSTPAVLYMDRAPVANTGLGHHSLDPSVCHG